LDEALSKTNGVSASTVSYSSKILSVVFYPRILSTEALQAKLKVWAQNEVPLKEFEKTSGGCPVHGISSFFGKIKAGLCFRN